MIKITSKKRAKAPLVENENVKYIKRKQSEREFYGREG